MKVMVNGREYEVTVAGEYEGRPVYELRGARGARYQTMRNAHRPEMLFLTGAALRWRKTAWLTDEGGTLRQVR